ncbi:MAG: hypothetical protein KatS3mg101_0956 [Patescibacteria group bacterium]|nr:MAG: hypothetical protein KatS3mg101_0956 [Patescibacteria group bacterium]
MDRNQRLLEMELKEEREKGEADPRTLLYLMKIYAERKDENLWKECIKMGYEYLEKSGWDAERALACSLMARCMGNLGNHLEAREFFG